MWKYIGYAVIILPIIVVAIKWQVSDNLIGGVVLAIAAVFNCTVWNNCYEQAKKKRD